MAKQSVIALCNLIVLLLALPADTLAATQEPQEKVFNLIVGREISETDEQEIAVVPPFIPAIEPGKLDLTFTLGYFNMGRTLFRHNRIIYKTTNEHLYFGNVKMKNETGFSPTLRLGYTLLPWLALEAQTGVTFSEFRATITEAHKINPLLGPGSLETAELAQYDRETRSTLIWINNLNAIWYPLNMGGGGRGRTHPYLIGGAGYAVYEMDSAYTDTRAGSANLSGGLGLLFIADKQIRIRAELVYQRHQIQFTPAEFFDERDQETVREPVYVFDELGNPQPVASYSKRTLGGLSMQLGFTALF